MAHEMSPQRPAPLAGVRILAVEQMQSMPYATQLLAQLGADVVKIEDPQRGEAGRSSRPSVRDLDHREVGATFLRNNLFKRSVTLDVRTKEGRDLLLRLAPNYDVVAENFKPGTADKLGFGYSDLVSVHPRVIYASVSGFGSAANSPYSNWPAYSATVEAMSGLYEANRVSDEPPRVGVAGPLGDIGTAVFAVIGILTALVARGQTGQSQRVDVAMFDAVTALQDMIPFMWSMDERRPAAERRRSAGILDSFQAADGYFIIQVVREHQFARLCQVIGRDEWIGDARFARRTAWSDHLDSALRPAIEKWASSLSKLDACRLLGDAGVAAAPSNTPAEVLADPHLRAHQMLLEVERPDTDEPFVVVGNPVKIDDAPSPGTPVWPRLGQHTDEILQSDLGLNRGELDTLRQQGVI
jgi:crotonobetainyl-CoA:carnitine CoA-transferase CaiB-like acyl-CoA transferase